MAPLILSTVISCSDAVGFINKLVSSIKLSPEQKIEIIAEIRKMIPTCPVTIKADESRKK
jgi:hypothetical protein